MEHTSACHEPHGKYDLKFDKKKSCIVVKHTDTL